MPHCYLDTFSEKKEIQLSHRCQVHKEMSLKSQVLCGRQWRWKFWTCLRCYELVLRESLIIPSSRHISHISYLTPYLSYFLPHATFLIIPTSRHISHQLVTHLRLHLCSDFSWCFLCFLHRFLFYPSLMRRAEIIAIKSEALPSCNVSSPDVLRFPIILNTSVTSLLLSKQSSPQA